MIAQNIMDLAVRKVVRQLVQAIQRGDLKTLDQIYADDFVGVAGTGQLVTKPQMFEFFNQHRRPKAKAMRRGPTSW